MDKVTQFIKDNIFANDRIVKCGMTKSGGATYHLESGMIHRLSRRDFERLCAKNVGLRFVNPSTNGF